MDPLFEPMDNLDRLIEEALSEEPFLRAPVSLHRGVEARLRIAALREREQARFSASMLTLVVVFVAVLTLAAGVLWFTNLSFLYSEGVFGGKGRLDYYMTAMAMSWTRYQGGYSLVASVALTFGTLFFATLLQIYKIIWSD